MLYKFDQYPHGAIGPVSFLWRQGTKLDTAAVTKDAQKSGREKQNVENSDTDLKLTTDCEIPEKEANISQLWIWSHPASFLSVFDAISEACNSVGRTSVERDSKFPENVKTDCVEKTQQSDQQKSVHSPLLNGIEHSVLRISSRRFDLLRFRLTGPQSHALLARTLTLCSNSKHKDFSDQIDKKESTFRNDKSIDISPKWWQKSLDSSSDLSSQNVLWGRLKQASSPSVLPAGCVIGLTVLDPRLDLPVKKISTATGAEGINAGNYSHCVSILGLYYLLKKVSFVGVGGGGGIFREELRKECLEGIQACSCKLKHPLPRCPSSAMNISVHLKMIEGSRLAC